MNEKIMACSVTGHRMIPGAQIGRVRRELRREVEAAAADGYTVFISGFASGADLEFAAIIVEMKKENPALLLEAALPYRGRLITREPLFQALIGECDHVHWLSIFYAPGCYLARNRYLVERAGRVIAVYDGRGRSGTAQTIRIAQKLGRELRIIKLD